MKGDQAAHAFIWTEWKGIQDLGGSLGGDFSGSLVLNEKGQSVGYAYLSGDTYFHAILWRRVGDMIDLGVLGTDECSYATAVNNRGQIAGASVANCTAQEPTFRAFLWEDGQLLDLNSLIPPNSSLYLTQVYTMNDSGEIAGAGEVQTAMAVHFC